MMISRTLSSLIASSLILCNTFSFNVNASIESEESIETESMISVETSMGSEDASEISVDSELKTSDNESSEDTYIDTSETTLSTSDQVEQLYTQISEYLGMNISYVRQLHLLTGGTYLYADTQPNVYLDKTVQLESGPLDITGANTVYQRAPFIDYEEIERPSKYYLPDALYSVCYDINSLMGQRYYYNRGDMQIYFDSLQESTKYNITFYESVLLYTGESEDTVYKLYTAYEKMLYDKQVNENVIETTSDNSIRIKDKFLNTLNDIGITSDISINHLTVMLSFDSELASNDDIESLKESYVVPYKLNYTSRENMMIAAMSLVGKVRYVWGGGHSGASNIDGINPVWIQWEKLYPDTPTSEVLNDDGTTQVINNQGFGKCLKTKNSWCPIHGYVGSEYHGGSIYSLDEYIELRKDILNTDDLSSEKYREMLSKIDYSEGINTHTLDGLDCSGFASWLYNQITSRYTVNSTAVDFTNQYAINEIEFGSELLPGDIFAWTTHIVVIVGKSTESGRAYVTVEQTPNVLKFGVIYYKGATSYEISKAYNIAKEANELIGGLNEYEKPSQYCMNEQGKVIKSKSESESKSETVEKSNESVSESESELEEISSESEAVDIESEDSDLEGTLESKTAEIEGGTMESENTDTTTEDEGEEEQICHIGRFRDKFLDEDTLVGEANKTIKSMTADEIIQYTITKLPISYVSGYNTYTGTIFNKNDVSSSLYNKIDTEETE